MVRCPHRMYYVTESGILIFLAIDVTSLGCCAARWKKNMRGGHDIKSLHPISRVLYTLLSVNCIPCPYCFVWLSTILFLLLNDKFVCTYISFFFSSNTWMRFIIFMIPWEILNEKDSALIMVPRFNNQNEQFHKFFSWGLNFFFIWTKTRNLFIRVKCAKSGNCYVTCYVKLVNSKEPFISRKFSLRTEIA